jgi:hypothetical protein
MQRRRQLESVREKTTQSHKKIESSAVCWKKKKVKKTKAKRVIL